MQKNISEPFGERGINWSIRHASRSLHLRLGLWALLLVGLIQVAAGGVLYFSTSAWLANQVDTSLRLTAAQVLAVMYDPAERPAVLDKEDIRGQFRGRSIAGESFLAEQSFFVRLIDRASNTPLAASVDYALPAPPPLTAASDRFDSVVIAIDGATQEVRIYTVAPDFAPGYALQVGVSLAGVRAIQVATLRLLLLVLGMTALLAPLGGWFLAGRALAPIDAITRTAAAINESDLAQRLNLASSEIELEQLMCTFNEMLERLTRAFRRERQFTADAAHELRTPLAIMQAGLEVTLSQERGAAQYRAALADAHEEVLRLSRLVNGLLTLTRIDAQVVPIMANEVDCSLLLAAAVDQQAVRAEQKQIRLAAHIAPDLRIRGDEIQLMQIVSNLLDNALKYTPPAGSVTVTAQQKGDRVELCIADTGPGIESAQLPLIFDRFYRADPARNREDGSFGLGLAIASQLVALHHGQIEVRSEQGHGTQFIVSFPKALS